MLTITCLKKTKFRVQDLGRMEDPEPSSRLKEKDKEEEKQKEKKEKYIPNMITA